MRFVLGFLTAITLLTYKVEVVDFLVERGVIDCGMSRGCVQN